MNTMQNNIANKDLKRRILEISYFNNLSHIGSAFTAVDIIDRIYQIKKPNEPFVLSSGHAGLAQYVVIEKYSRGDSTGLVTGLNAEKIFLHHGVHPDRCAECQLDVSTGSLGQGLPIAVGMALADRKRNVYCLISDGEIAEGSIYEALRFAHTQKLKNLIIHVNMNGYSALGTVNKRFIRQFLGIFDLPIHIHETNTNQLPFLRDLDAHYYQMTETDFKWGMRILEE